MRWRHDTLHQTAGHDLASQAGAAAGIAGPPTQLTGLYGLFGPVGILKVDTGTAVTIHTVISLLEPQLNTINPPDLRLILRHLAGHSQGPASSRSLMTLILSFGDQEKTLNHCSFRTRKVDLDLVLTVVLVYSPFTVSPQYD